MQAYRFLMQWACLLLVGMSPLPGNSMASGDQTNYEAIDQYITSRMRSDHIPGVAVAIVKGDQIVYLKGYGRADPFGRAVTPQTPFIIGSITKTITALAVMQLVEAGKVELDAPVQRYIPWFRVADPEASAQITVRMLIEQTSGLAQLPTFITWTWPNDPDVLERHVRLMARRRRDPRRHGLRRERRVQLPGGRELDGRPRPPRDDPPSPRDRSRETHVPPQRD